MQAIRTQRDLGDLPEPRFIYLAPAWLRWSYAGMLLFGAAFAAP